MINRIPASAKYKTQKMRRYESSAAKRKKLNAAKAEIEKSTRLDSFFRAVPASESSSLDTCTSTQNQTDDVAVLPETVTDLDACACTGGSSSSSHLDFVQGGDEVDLSNCPAPADTITSGADPAADRNKEIVAGFDLAKLCDYEFKIPQSKRDKASNLLLFNWRVRIDDQITNRTIKYRK